MNMHMSFWSDECDVYAAWDLRYVAKEQHANGIIGDYEFDQDAWKQVSPFDTMWTIALEDIDFNEMKEDFIYKMLMSVLYLRPLWYVWMFHQKDLYSKTGLAWFMCSSEY